MLSSLAKFALTGKNGSYVYAIKVTSTTNPNRSATTVSGKFTVGTGSGTTTGGATSAPRLRGTSRPSIVAGSGGFRVGSSLRGLHGSWDGSPTSFSRTWQRCSAAGGDCVEIAGQTGLSYLLAAADLGFKIRFEVKATNAGGSKLETSAATPVITAAGG